MASTKHMIYFVRHGQCTANVTGETLPPEKDIITDIGIKQSEVLGEHLKDVEFTQAIASTYTRSIDTVSAILSKLNKPSQHILTTDSRMREREMGILIGLSAKEIFPKILEQLKEGKKFNTIEIPEAESTAVYEGRIRSFFKDLFDGFKNSKEPQTVLVVSHGLTMRRFLSGITQTFSDICTVSNWESSQRKCHGMIENTGYTQMQVEFPAPSEKPVVTFLKIHCTDHLESMEGDMPSNNNKRGDHDISGEQKRLMIEMVMQIPGAKEELSGCVHI